MEASLIYPLIILVTVLMMAVSLFFYNMAAQLSDMNRCVRRTAGEKSGTVYYGEPLNAFGSSFSVENHTGLLSEYVKTEGAGTFHISGMFLVSESVSIGAKADVLCEMEKVRMRQGISSLFSELTE